VVKWIAGGLAGLAVLVALAVFVLTTLIDANRFKGTVERLVQETSGQPFHIDGNLDITWYPWLALEIGAARLGNEPALVQWKSVSVGARLIPLIRGQLVVSRIRVDGLQAHLIRGADGHGNWEPLIVAHARSRPAKSAPQIAGLEVRNGTIEYIDPKRAAPVLLTDWKLDTGAWQSDKPLPLETTFKLQGGAPSAETVTASTRAKGTLKSTAPLRANGELSIRTSSLRQLLDQLAIGGPRPRDSQALRRLELDAEWAFAGGAFTMKPISARIDDTAFHGEVRREKEQGAILHVELRGDRIALDRYVRIESSSNEPFELPATELKALRVAGMLSFAEARIGGATVRNARIRLETSEEPTTGSASGMTRIEPAAVTPPT
jgi:AsmA protein